MAHRIAAKIRETLSDQGLSVSALEKKAGLKSQAVQNIVSGKIQQPSFDVVSSIAHALGYTIDELAGGPGATKNNPLEEIMFSNHILLASIFGYLKDNLVSEKVERSSLQIFEAIQEIYQFI